MRINEAYEHEPLLETVCPPTNTCNKISTQCVDISAPLVLTPSAVVGTVTIACQGNPTISCLSEECGTSCTLVFTQQLCVSVPVTYGVELVPGEACIACADATPGASCTCRK